MGRVCAGVGFLVAVFASALPPPAQSAVLPSGFHDNVVLGGLEEPTAVSFAPDGRIFVAEKAGRVMVYDDFEDEAPDVFADLRTEVYDLGDRGILGMELDPAFPERPYVYLIHTYDAILDADPEDTEESKIPRWGSADTSGDPCPVPSEADIDACPVSGRIVRLEAAGNTAVAELPLVEGWCQQWESHSIGDIQFDSVGNLYASGGEGAGALGTDYGQHGWPYKNQCGDPPVGIGALQTVPTAEGGALRSQDVRTPNPLGLAADPTGLSGSVIRIDPNTGEGIPGNPMFDSLDANERRIVAHGFRNPFRFAFDREKDNLYVANVGWQEYEEIDEFAVNPEGAYNSGWPCYEGPVPHFMYDGLDLNLCEALYEDPGAVTEPLFSYRYDGPVYPGDPCPTEEGSAISGISVYDGDAFPAAYDGALFFADSVRSCIYVMPPDEEGHPDPAQTTAFLADGGIYPGIDLEVGPDGDLYYMRIFGGEDGKGALHRVSYDPGAPQARLEATPTYGEDDPLEVELDASDSTDPEGDPLQFDWDLDGDGQFDDIVDGAAGLTEEISGPGRVRVAVRVTDDEGKDSVAKVSIFPGNTPPQLQVTAPLTNLKWAVGDEIQFEGAATDGEDGDVPTANLFWRVRLLHCTAPSACHQHPRDTFSGIEEGSFTAPDHDYPAELEVEFTATDSQGLSATEVVVLEPRTVELEIASSPPGLMLSAGTKSAVTPFPLTAIENSNVVLSAPEIQELGGVAYVWKSWSNGGERAQTVVAGAPASYTAVYGDDPPVGPGDPPVDPGPAGPSDSPPAPPEPQARTQPPQTRLLGKPAKRSRSGVARFRFSASTAKATFRCKLDRGRFVPCRSPRVYRGLRPGNHVFRVVAKAAGATDRTPAVYRWRVLPRR